MIEQLGEPGVNEPEPAARSLHHRSTICDGLRIAVKADHRPPRPREWRRCSRQRRRCHRQWSATAPVRAPPEPPGEEPECGGQVRLGRQNFPSPMSAAIPFLHPLMNGQELAVRSFRACDCISSNAAGCPELKMIAPPRKRHLIGDAREIADEIRHQKPTLAVELHEHAAAVNEQRHLVGLRRERILPIRSSARSVRARPARPSRSPETRNPARRRALRPPERASTARNIDGTETRPFASILFVACDRNRFITLYRRFRLAGPTPSTLRFVSPDFDPHTRTSKAANTAFAVSAWNHGSD
jgi:hypothetical protein